MPAYVWSYGFFHITVILTETTASLKCINVVGVSRGILFVSRRHLS